MITDNKKLKMIFMIFSLACLVGIGVCLICDFAINKAITWSSVTTSSVLLGWAVGSPLLLAKQKKIFVSFAALTICVLPFLYLLERLGPTNGWFTPLALPIGVAGIVSLWLAYALIRYIKINIWYLLSAMVFIFDIGLSTIIRIFVSSYVGESFFSLDSVINLFAGVVITALLAIIGYGKNKNKIQ